MSERRKREIATVYLELAFERFNKSAATKDATASETMRRMAHSYVAQAVALHPSLGRETGAQEKREVCEWDDRSKCPS
jgi:hypothetical protein